MVDDLVLPQIAFALAEVLSLVSVVVLVSAIFPRFPGCPTKGCWWIEGVRVQGSGEMTIDFVVVWMACGREILFVVPLVVLLLTMFDIHWRVFLNVGLSLELCCLLVSVRNIRS